MFLFRYIIVYSAFFNIIICDGDSRYTLFLTSPVSVCFCFLGGFFFFFNFMKIVLAGSSTSPANYYYTVRNLSILECLFVIWDAAQNRASCVNRGFGRKFLYQTFVN